MITTFHNVLISIEADTPEEAYARLCGLLNAAGVEYTTDTFSTYDQGERVGNYSTELLFPTE
jgi:hypothetical protein